MVTHITFAVPKVLGEYFTFHFCFSSENSDSFFDTFFFYFFPLSRSLQYEYMPSHFDLDTWCDCDAVVLSLSATSNGRRVRQLYRHSQVGRRQSDEPKKKEVPFAIHVMVLCLCMLLSNTLSSFSSSSPCPSSSSSSSSSVAVMPDNFYVMFYLLWVLIYLVQRVFFSPSCSTWWWYWLWSHFWCGTQWESGWYTLRIS